MARKIKIKSIATYNGHNVRPNKSVDISFKFEYSELTKYITLVQLLNENISISVKKHDEPVTKLGTFLLKDMKIDHDGESVIKFNSMTDQSEVQVMHTLTGDEPFRIMFEAEIEEAEEE